MPFRSPAPPRGLSAVVRGFWKGALILVALAASGLAAEAPPAFKIQIERDGAYRVRFEDLRFDGAFSTSRLGLFHQGKPVPVFVEDQGDGRFGPGDWVEFLGDHAKGEVSHSSEYSRYNAYFLRFDAADPLRTVSPNPRKDALASEPPAPLRRTQHLEEDLLILRLPPAKGAAPEEIWYWAKLVFGQEFSTNIDLSDIDPRGGGPVGLRIHFRGWSEPGAKPSPETSDHQVEVLLNGAPVGRSEWNGTKPHVLEIPGLTAQGLLPGPNVLSLKIPARPGVAGQPLIDVVMLNWIEFAYPRNRQVADEQVRFSTAAPLPGAMALHMDGAAGRSVILYGDKGSRSVSSPSGTVGGPRVEHRFRALPGETAFVAADATRLLAPAVVARDRPSDLSLAANRADYIIVTHESLRDAIKPLADMHRARGLEVMVVDIEDVYDEFNAGVVHPKALRDFLSLAYHQWRRPAPRFVLLVGDASWDARNERAVDANYADWTYRPGEGAGFVKNGSTLYPKDAALNRHGLIPTWNYTTDEGHSASDNYFVAVDGADDLPDMAIGRLPVVEPAEVAQIVAKTIRYVRTPEVGPWRRSALFITNEDPEFQSQSDRLALDIEGGGFSAEKVYPASSEVSNEHHTRRLIDTLDQGQLFVHFLGHGGRYIWQTGPPDLNKNHDLFSLDDLEKLAPTGRLPIVLSLTCYSAPFDHPSADSIGEKLLRLQDRGAVAVFAASWRNTPSATWGEVLLEELTAPGVAVGEAIRRAKRRVLDPMFVETYNLLGDPAAPVALPTGKVSRLRPEFGSDGRILRVRGNVDLDTFTGKVLVELVDSKGRAIATAQSDASGPEFTAEWKGQAPEAAPGFVLRAYAWDSTRGVDAVGAIPLDLRSPATISGGGR
jgi:hypothetical protein